MSNKILDILDNLITGLPTKEECEVRELITRLVKVSKDAYGHTFANLDDAEELTEADLGIYNELESILVDIGEAKR